MKGANILENFNKLAKFLKNKIIEYSINISEQEYF